MYLGVHPSPLGIALVVLLLVGSMYYLVHITTSPGLNEQVSIKQLLVAGIDIAERGGQEVCFNNSELERIWVVVYSMLYSAECVNQLFNFNETVVQLKMNQM